MRRLVLIVNLTAAALLAGPAFAQQPARTAAARPTVKVEAGPSLSASEIKATPEMWFYEQEMKRYNDPQARVYQNAAFEFAQRKQRIAALKWYGYSKSRPMVNPTPFGSSYAPGWTNGMVRPNSWARQPQVLVHRASGE